VTVKKSNPPTSAHRFRKYEEYDKLVEIANTVGEWGQLSTHADKVKARKVVYHLRSGGRKVPPGEWEFVYGQEDDSELYGVWARLITKPKEKDAKTHVGRINRSG
jgi:hypothetical protein